MFTFLLHCHKVRCIVNYSTLAVKGDFRLVKEAGLKEVFLPALKREGDGRLWRSVPGRRWYSDQRGDTPGSQEVVLFHRKGDIARRTVEVKPPLEASSVVSGKVAR